METISLPASVLSWWICAFTSSTWLPVTFADGRGAEMLRRMVPGIHDHDVYLCGPEPWMASVRRDLRAAGVPAAQIHSEAFGV